jgi:hypothetical protein
MRKLMIGLITVALLAGMVTPGVALAASKHKAVRAKPVSVSHPYTARQKYGVGHSFKVTGYVAPKASSLTSKTIEILVYKRTSTGSWEQTATVVGSLYNRRFYKHRTLYSAKISLPAVGRYRIRARYTWEATDGTKRTKLGSYKYIRAFK